MKLSRLTLILGLAAALGLNLSAKHGVCASSKQSLSQPAEQSGSPSYQAAQSYDSYDCFYAGCHADYGDVLPELEADETNVSEAENSVMSSSEDADLPGDDPALRSIPASVTKTPLPLPSYGFAGYDEATSATPPRGYFAPGYPHPGYQHPSYGYSHAMDTSKVFLNEDQSIHTEEVLDIADLQEEPVPPEPEEFAEDLVEETTEESVVESSPYGDDYDYGYGYGESYEYEYEYDYDTGYEAEYGEYVAEEPAVEEEAEDIAAVKEILEEEVAEAEANIQEEYTHYDDIYGYGSEWYGPYDATQVDAGETAEASAESVAETEDEAIVETESAAVVEAVDPPIDDWLAEISALDAGPAEMEVDLNADEDFSEEDAESLNAAVKEAVDDWFYRETYGYGPRYDYDMYGYEDFQVESSPALATTTGENLTPRVASPKAENSFRWDYVYRLDMADIATDSVKIPFAAAKTKTEIAEANAGILAAPATTAGDPALPVSVDYDPTALISTSESLAKRLSEKPLLAEVQDLWTTLTPMELARKALAAAPQQKRQTRSVLVAPQAPKKVIEPAQQTMHPAVALRELAVLLDEAGQALLMLSHRVEALADATSPQEILGPSAPLQSRVPATEDLETR